MKSGGFTLKPFFFARTRREKVLALLFVIVGILIWFSSFSTRLSTFLNSRQTLVSLAANQDLYISKKAQTEKHYDQAMARIDKSKLPDRNQFTGNIDALLRKQNLDFHIDAPLSQVRPPLIFNTINVTINKADLGGLITFTDAIRNQLPYVSLEQLTLLPDRKNPVQLDARLRLVAIEFNH